MARAEHFDVPDEEMVAALCPASDFDRQESAQWLTTLLHRLHKEVSSTGLTQVRFSDSYAILNEGIP